MIATLSKIQIHYDFCRRWMTSFQTDLTYDQQDKSRLYIHSIRPAGTSLFSLDAESYPTNESPVQYLFSLASRSDIMASQLSCIQNSSHHLFFLVDTTTDRVRKLKRQEAYSLYKNFVDQILDVR